ncbi:membrane-spanning 4-domains subfamily A member 8-like isoform X2 [Tiliqua scincoides]
MATQPVRMPTGPMVFIPPNGTTTTQAGQAIPGTTIHTPGVVQYAGQPLGIPSNQLIPTSGMMHIQYVGQQPRSPNNQCPQNPWMKLWEKLYKAESKTLGAIQIIIGLMHIGFGAARVGCFVYFVPFYIPFAALTGYPFWGGLLFIISGSLSVSAENQPNTCSVQCSVGFNITSSIAALIGIILYIVELVLPYTTTSSISSYNAVKNFGVSVAILLLLFSFLEFCITVSTAHFGCQAACCTNDMALVVMPYTQTVIPAEGSLSPPAYNNVDSSSMRSAEERTQKSSERHKQSQK